MRLKVLMLAFEGGGNVPPTLGAAKALARRGHNVRLLCDDCIRQAAEAAGARVTPWRAAPNRRDRSPDSSFVRDWDAPDPQAALAAWLDGMFVGPAFRHARDVVDAASEEPPDVVVGADLLFGGMIAAEVLGRPHALLAPNLALPSLPGHPPLGPGLPPARTDAERAKHREVARFVESLFDRFLPMLNAARSEFGLAPLAHVFDQIAPDRLLLATSRNFDYPLAALPEHVRYIGPILDEPDWAASAPARERPPRTRPYALVAFGTTRQGQDRAIETVLAALARLDLDGLVTLGPAMTDWPFAAPKGVEIVNAASHDALMREAAVVVTHAGHGTTLRALRAGAPIVAMPMGRDQNENAARVEYHGAGLRLGPDAAVEDIAGAITRVVREPSFATRARALADAIAGEGDGAERFADEIETLAEVQSPPTPIGV